LFPKYFSYRPSYLIALALAFFALFIHPAYADPVTATAAATLGDVFNNLYVNTKPFGDMFQYASYAAGVLCVVQGIHHFRLHSENPANNPMVKPLMLMAGGAGLLLLPSVVDTVVTTIGLNAAAPNTTVTALACGAGTGLDAMICNLVSNIKAPMISLVSMIAGVSGIFMIVRGLVKASKHGIDSRTHSMHSILTHILFGGLLFSISSNLGMMMSSVFGTSTISPSSVINWSFADALAGGASQQFQSAVTAGLTFIQIIGVIAFVRGWMVMKKVVEGGGNATMAQGITHIVGGVAAINIFAFLKIMDTTFGTGLL